MNYPLWDVPVIGGMWVIGIMSIVHVMLSHFAIGGGLYLPVAEMKALREGKRDWLPVIRRHSRFFLVVTAALGTVTGVGIWFSIGLANPEATSTLIHNFVFAWAIEWTVFLTEITAAAVYYYTWGRISDRLHLMVGWVYAAASALTLVVINGILGFMLTPGPAWLSAAGSGQEAREFWPAFFNASYFPSLLLRALVCMALAGTYALITVSRLDGPRLPQVKAAMGRWSARWLLPAFVLTPLAFLWYVSALPESVRELAARGISTAGVGQFTQITRAALLSILTSGIIYVVASLILWKDPSDLKLGQALAITFLALVATGSTEWAREMLRKPYVVHDYLYSNGVRTSEIGPGARFSKEGYLDRSPWARQSERASWAAADARGASGGPVRGELVFRGECMSCHTLDGYRSMRKLLAGRDRAGIDSILRLLREVPEDSPYKAFMPPLVGTDSEVRALGDYLEALSPPVSAP